MKKSCSSLLFLIMALTASVRADTIITNGSTWKYVFGTQEASSPIRAWQSNTFNDATWLSGAGPIGDPSGPPPDDPGGWEARIVTVVPQGTTNMYFRKTFTLSNPAIVNQIDVTIVCDDGYVAYINGVEIDRFNCPGAPGTDVPFTALATATADENNLVHVIPVTQNLSTTLVPGVNVLAVHVLNQSAGSSDLVFEASLATAVDATPPALLQLIPPAGATVVSLGQIETDFTEPVTGIDAGDLFINGEPATNLIILSPSQFIFEFPQPPTGTVQVAFTNSHGITDLAAIPNAFGSNITWTYTLDTNPPPSTVIINEFMAINSGSQTNSIRDEDGDDSDWIELYNSGTAVISLNGWFLTDATNVFGNPTAKWRFPNVSINPNAYVVIFASGKNRTNAASRLHTNFQLSSGGEYLGLLDAMTNVVSEFRPSFPQQSTDVSYGRAQGAPLTLGFFPVPTPGGPNSSGGPGFAPDVIFSRASDTFISAFSLSLSTTNPAAVIRFTTDGTAVTVSSPIYSAPINISASTRVRARAFQAGLLPGAPRGESYVLLSGAVANVSSDLPIVIVHTFGAGNVTATERGDFIAAFEPIGGRSSITNAPHFSGRAGVNLRGSSTEGFPKSSFAIELWDEFNQPVQREFVGLPEESDFVLYGPNLFDCPLIHNSWIYQLSRDMGSYASRTRFVEVYLKDDAGAITAADYNGVYVLEEKVKRDKNRVAIDELQPEQTNSPAITGGYLMKIDRADGDERTFNAGGFTIIYQSPDGLEMVTPLRAPQASYLTGFLNSFANALNGASYTNPITGYAPFIDEEKWHDHSLLNVLTINVDALRLSAYFHKPRNGGFTMGPAWDFDRSAGTSKGDTRPYNPRSWLGIGADGGTDFFNAANRAGYNNVWYGRMFTDVDYWQRYIDRYQTLRSTYLSTNYINGIIDSQANELREAQVREQTRWTGSGNSDTSPRNGNITANGYSYTFSGTYQGEIDFQKTWLADRLEFMDTNFLDRPVFSAPGGPIPSGFVLTLTGPAKAGSTIYYTLDGTDPRLPGGGLAPGALTYSNPIILTNNVRVVARSRNLGHVNMTGAANPPSTTPWSGVTAETYFTSLPALRITEIMYHPPPAPPGNATNDADNFEYVEVKNISSSALNVNGFRLRGGVDFNFPNLTLAAGQATVVVANSNSFRGRYGAGPLIAGTFTNRLDNGGENLKLQGRFLEPILDFAYDDDWYPSTDGLGYSLVIVDENAALDTWGLKASWRPSGALYGSPATNDPAPPTIPLVVVSEVLTHTDLPQVDAIELQNLTGGQIDIGGWFLSDDLDEPKKFVIPAGTMMDAGGFVVFYESNSFGLGATPFTLNSKGDDVYLSSGDGTNLTGYVTGFDFGASANGVSFGRHVISTGADHFPAQAALTLGATNAGPLVGPIVVSEIMYRAPDIQVGVNLVDNDIDEYIELQNISATAVELFDTNHPANTWRLRDAVEFDFPQGTIIPAGEFIVVVGFDPVRNTGLLQAFRSRFGVPPTVPVLGPFRGQLNNGGDSVELVRPDAPEPVPGAAVPYLLVERVSYTDQAPWPVAADGIGPALQRLNTSAYGNDPANWAAALPTPGLGYAGGTAPAITVQPVSQVVALGANVVLSVTAINNPPFRYQWRFNGSILPGATNATLNRPNIQFAQGGAYDVIVINQAGSAVSSNAVVTVQLPPFITTQPASRSVHPGSNVTFSVVATGTAPIRYQWRLNNMTIMDATNSFYSLVNIQPGADGSYSVFLTNAAGSALSSNATLLVYTNPAITLNLPTNVLARAGSNVTLTVTATTSTPITYQWFKNGTNIPGVTGPSLLLTNIQPAADGAYVVLLSNAYGSILSSTSQVSVLVTPLILQQPQGATVLQGDPVTFSVTASGNPFPLSYRWRKVPGGLTITNMIISATNSTLTLLNVQPYFNPAFPNAFTNGSTFSVVVTNIAGASALSANAVLTVLADNDGDRIPDDWERLYNFNTNSLADAMADPDLDGMSNLKEYLAGTNPTNGLSYLRIDAAPFGGVPPSALLLTLSAVSNHSYTITCCDDLLTTNWVRLADIDARTTNRIVTVTNQLPVSVTNRFYRLETPKLLP